MPAPTAFTLPADTQRFLADLRAHNDKAWFEANRARYEAAYLEPARGLVEALAPGLAAIVPGVRAEPKVLGSIFRIHRDTRFSADKRPYKDHLDFWFWQGDRKASVSGLFLRVLPDAVVVGAGAHHLAREQVARYRAAVSAPSSGGELVSTVEGLEGAGHLVGGETRARTPKGYEAVPAAERFLRHDALFVHADLPAGSATAPDLVATLLDRWRAFAPLHAWLVTTCSRPDAGAGGNFSATLSRTAGADRRQGDPDGGTDKEERPCLVTPH